MELSRRHALIALGLVLTGLAALVLFGIGQFGIWDPWELNAADLARDLLAGEAAESKRAPLTPWLTARSFGVFGVHEWSGRLPVALGGLLAIVAAAGWAWRFAGRRAALYAALVAGTSPLLLFNARQMLGDAWGMAAS
ncbi:MAG TPA: glycosyltransferase family 39 protein, partial [Polyangiaceae bacterium LLY-WYZ-15_(1-7)]|nr:glycosyltransferase family 39 protein [Polyangiaceae bacterium LLY-WYZ-15_(1-7)]